MTRHNAKNITSISLKIGFKCLYIFEIYVALIVNIVFNFVWHLHYIIVEINKSLVWKSRPLVGNLNHARNQRDSRNQRRIKYIHHRAAACEKFQKLFIDTPALRGAFARAANSIFLSPRHSRATDIYPVLRGALVAATRRRRRRRRRYRRSLSRRCVS